jgi:alkanesulfonate monooxygenase SsuD/methylene tetrahydromethanopterin reductase-like flavin-dependent oxidoreductase (luciferase family)
MMEIHVQLPPQEPYSSLKEKWILLDRAGIDGLWTWDHFFTEWLLGGYEAWTLLAALGEATSCCRIGVLVTAPTFRNPALLSRMVTTVDHISEGRLTVGLGTGRLAAEHRAFGFDFPPPDLRTALLAETCRVVKGLLEERTMTYEGTFVSIKRGMSLPKPVQRPFPPILIGGASHGVLEVAAQHADWWNVFANPERFGRASTALDAELNRIDRSCDAVKRMATIDDRDAGWEKIDAFRSFGADAVVIVPTDGDGAGVMQAVERLGIR